VDISTFYGNVVVFFKNFQESMSTHYPERTECRRHLPKGSLRDLREGLSCPKDSSLRFASFRMTMMGMYPDTGEGTKHYMSP